jgi:hypothetical protein
MKATTISRKYEHITLPIAEKLTECTPSVLEKVNDMFFLGYCRPCALHGSGRYTRNNDLTDNVKCAFDRLGIKLGLVNDAERGGKCGNILHFVGDDTWKVIGDTANYFGIQFNEWKMIVNTSCRLPDAVRKAYDHLCGEA